MSLNRIPLTLKLVVQVKDTCRYAGSCRLSVETTPPHNLQLASSFVAFFRLLRGIFFFFFFFYCQVVAMLLNL